MARQEPTGKKVKILVPWQAAPDGVNVHDYAAGDEHEVGTSLMPEDLAHELANCGVIDDPEFGTKDSEVKDGNVKARQGKPSKGGFSLPSWEESPAKPAESEFDTGASSTGKSSKSK
jgi:hypothetical protein